MTSLAKLIGSISLGATLVLSAGCLARAESSPPPAGPSATYVTLRVEGMTCASCAFTVRTALEKLDGVKNAKVSKAENQAVIDYDPAKVTPKQMVDAINKLGYRASLPAAEGS